MDLTPVLKLNLPAFAFEPWDDEVNDNFDVIDAFVGSIVGVNNYAGVWMNDTAYTQGQQVIDTADSSFWSCNVSHTSAAAPDTFLVDRANHPTYWVLKQNSAKQYAEDAAQSAADAAQSAADAQAAYNAIMPDAPHNGVMYGRINGTWQQAVALDSPFFVGDPRAPTPPLSDNDNSLATTAFVKGIVGSSAAFVTIGESPPPSPSIGSLWWDDIGGQLYVYYYDSNSYQWVAVNSATGGMGTGFMPIVGGAFTGPVSMTTGNLTLSSAAITANLHATTKQYVDTTINNTVNNKTYPYLPLAGGNVTGPSTFQSTLTIWGTTSSSGNIWTGGAVDATTTITSGQMLRSNNGRIMNYAPNYGPSLTFWRGDVGARGLWSNGNDIRFGQMDGAGTPLVDYGGWNTSNDFVAVNAIWATNRVGSFGLQDFGGNTYGLRFSSDGWRISWNGNTGALFFYNPSSTALMTVDGGGNMSCNGAFYAPGQIQAGGTVYGGTGVRFGYQNGWEYGAWVDGAGNQISHHRGGYYEYWATSGGDTHWIKNNAEVMLLTSAADLSGLRNISSNGGMFSGYIQSSGNMHAIGTHTGGAVSVSGDVYGSAHYGPNGIFAGGAGDTSFGIYRSGNNRILNFNPNKFLVCDASNGNMTFYIDGASFLNITRYGVFAGLTEVVYNQSFTGGFAARQFVMAYGGGGLVSRTATTTRGLAQIMQLAVGEYDIPANDEQPSRRAIAISAYDLAEHLPEVSRAYNDDAGAGYSVDVGSLLAVAVNAIKELGARVVALEARSGA